MKTIKITIFLTFLIGILSAQTYTISGKVTNNNGYPLTGANIWIGGTSLGASTDLNGVYSIKMIKVGKYDLNAAFIGHRSLSKSIVVSLKFCFSVKNVIGTFMIS